MYEHRFIYELDDFASLVADDLGLIVDPMVLRAGHLFLEGGADLSPEQQEHRWASIERHLSALVVFFDVIVMHRRFPAFNYWDTFPDGEGRQLSQLLNVGGDAAIEYVDAEHDVYREVKQGAIEQMNRQFARAPIPGTGAVEEPESRLAEEIDADLTAVDYQWAPGLDGLDFEVEEGRPARVVRFILGQLVFSGYAQLSGAPHILSPKRSQVLSSLGLHPSQGRLLSESAMYDEMRRRAQANVAWRVEQAPWTPSFLPFLVQRAWEQRYRNGPDRLLEQAKELRDSKAVERYRTLRKEVDTSDDERAREARDELDDAAKRVARALDGQVTKLVRARDFVVELGAGAVGAGVAAAVTPDPHGPMAEGARAAVQEAAKRAMEESTAGLWNWYLERLAFRSARKLLTRTITAEFVTSGQFAATLRAIWGTHRTDAAG